MSMQWRRKWQDKIHIWFERSPMAGDFMPLSVAIGVGIVTGLGSYIFIWLLGQIGDFSQKVRDEGGLGMALVLMALAGAMVGFLIARYASETKGGGVPQVMEAIALRRGRIRPRVAASKITASSITIGAGGSAGREGPIVQVGAALGSWAGQLTGLSDEQVGVLVASGAAAGIASAFNAPIAGTMFALEVILGRLSNRYLGMVVIAAVSANVVSRALLGDRPAFEVPAYPLNSAWELPIYFLMALVCALGAVLFIHVLHGAEHIFDQWKAPLPTRAAAGMALTGLVGLAHPEVLGSGLEFIGESVAEDVDLALGLLVGLFFLKLAATCCTLGAGNSGGVFAPGLFMGAMVGGAFGTAAHEIWPNVVVNPGAFALVGMAAMFAGSARAPLTAIIIVLEMSNDYRLILPLMLGVIVSTLLADLLHPDSIYTRKLTRRGIRLERGQDIDLLQAVTVEEVLTPDYPSISPDTRLIDVIVTFNHSHHHGFPIVDAYHHLHGIVTLSDVERAHNNDLPFDASVIEFGTTQNLVTVYPDDPMHVALRRMTVYGIGRLPVVSRAIEGRYLGMIRRDGILHAYDLGLARKSMARHRQERFKLRSISDDAFVEFEVHPDALMVGRSLREFRYSDDCLIVSIQRKCSYMMAHGDTVIKAGDVLTAYAKREMHETVRQQFCMSEFIATQQEGQDQ